MKAVVLTFALASFLTPSVLAQTAACDTLILPNDRILSVRIDSIVNGEFVYKFCDSGNPNQYRLSASIVKQAKIVSNPKTVTSAPQNIGQQPDLEALKEEVQLYGPVKKWVFKHRVKKIAKSISKGQKIKVSYRDAKNTWQSAKGTLVNISADQLTLLPAGANAIAIPTQSIESINIYDKKNDEQKGFGTILLILGILAFLLATGAWAKRTRDDLLGVFDWNTGEAMGCLFGALGALVGFILLILSIPETIAKPFSSDWTVTETPADTETADPQVPDKKIP